MYPSVDWLENVGRERLEKIQKGEIVKPHVVCEYAHAMGNSIGNFKEYWETYERYPALIGGFIWDWVDQSLRMPTPDGKGFYMAVGGDFGDKPNDGNFCTNGVIFSDRTLSAKSYEMKKIHQPIRIEALGNGKYRISNKRFHANMEDLYGRYEITEDGRTVCSGNLEDLKLEAQASKVITLPDIPQRRYRSRILYQFQFLPKKRYRMGKSRLRGSHRTIQAIKQRETYIRTRKRKHQSKRNCRRIGGERRAFRSRLLQERRNFVGVYTEQRPPDEQRTRTEPLPCSHRQR